MKNEFIKNLEKDNKTFVFVSPHFDDALLSCGSWIERLVKNGKKVVVLNVFTKGHAGPYTLSAKKYLKDNGFTDACKLYEAREKEDRVAVGALGANVINLDFQDAIFRKKEKASFFGNLLPEFSHVYPTYRLHVVGRGYKNDPVISGIVKELKRVVPSDAVVISPFGTGGHADHILTRDACEKAFGKVIYYADFPYSLTSKDHNRSGYQIFSQDVERVRKEEILKLYKTQYKLLFADGLLPKHKEEILIKKHD